MVRDPAGFEADCCVCAPDHEESLRGFEFFFESFFLRLPNMLVVVEDDDRMLERVDSRGGPPVLLHCPLYVASETDMGKVVRANGLYVCQSEGQIGTCAE